MPKIKYFNYVDLSHMDDGEFEYPWFFTCAMIWYCKPIFDDCEDNHDVADVLEKAGVITKEDQSDPEACQLFVNFKTKKQGRAFIDRLNVYLSKQVGETFTPPELKVADMTVDEIADMIDSGHNRNIQVERGERFAQNLTEELLNRGWRYSDSYSACSKATYEVNLAKNKEQINIITTPFLGVFTQIESTSYFPTNLEILQEKSNARSSNA